tara:strand:- start:631 stop:3198 length:2568 start_codon:yes stop_codon:yes gene_type:complete
VYRALTYAIGMLIVISVFPSYALIGNVESEEDELPEWGFYVYMAGDNTLYQEVTDDLNEMKMVGSNDNLEIVALTDQLLGNDSHAYRVIKHGLEETPLSDINSTWENEIDMGDGETLKDFMVWAASEYPAKRKILVIWNHGSGWKKVAEDRDSHLTVPEIRESIEEYREITGDPPLTLIGFDACLMGMFEIAYELKEHAEMIHGSEAYEPLEGWTYNHLLYKLDEDMTNSELAYHVVNDYVESYRNGSVYTSYSVTAAVVDTNKLDNLNDKLENFSSTLNSILPLYKDQISYSRDETQRYDQNPDYRDLYDLAVNVENRIPVYDARMYAGNLRNSIEDAVISEDHWQKPGKLPVDRAHGLTIYFPTEGIEEGYSDLSNGNSEWADFIENFAIEINTDSQFTTLNSTSVDTGTGYNDSVMIVGSYEGNASKIKIRLMNTEGNLTNAHESNLENGIIPEIYLQPTKSGNYTLEIGIYGDEGFLHDHHINENLFIDLHLPDLAVNSPKIFIENDMGGLIEIQNVEKNDSFLIQGSIHNLGTVKAENVTVVVNDNGNELNFEFSEIEPGQSKNWNISKENIDYYGEYTINVIAFSEDEFEIDGTNNLTSRTFYVFDNVKHQYDVDSKNKNLLEMETSNSGEYEFSWLETSIIIDNSKSQSWDLIDLEVDVPEGWDYEKTESFLHTSDRTEIELKIRPILETKSGEYKVVINLTDRNGFEAGHGEITVNVPQYYGVSIYAEQKDGEVSIGITNTGNGNDYFKLTKDLDEGLTIYLTETYFELEAFETIVVKGAGIETSMQTQKAKFKVQSVGNENITAEVLLDVSSPQVHNEESNWIISIVLALSAMVAMTYFIYQRRIQ